jgi:hypothetical protein
MITESHAVRELVEDPGITGWREQARRYRLTRDHVNIGREKAKPVRQFTQSLMIIATAVDHKVTQYLSPRHAIHRRRAKRTRGRHAGLAGDLPRAHPGAGSLPHKPDYVPQFTIDRHFKRTHRDQVRIIRRSS